MGMAMKIDRTRLLTRRGGHRDARLFILATEGKETEKQYFEALHSQGVIDRRRVHIEVLPSETGSAPQHVIARLDGFARQYRLHIDFDQLWLVSDLDHWSKPSHIGNLARVAKDAHVKGYFLAVSNPCFELWLLLHFTDEVAEILACSGIGEACRACKEALRRILGGYDSARLEPSHFERQHVTEAIARAGKLDASSPSDRWPQTTGTHMYRLVRALIASGDVATADQ